MGSHSIIHTEKQKNPCDLDLWPTTLTLNRVLKVVEVHVHAKFHQVQRFMSYQQCTKFQTTLRLDREYLWNGSSNQQVEISIMNSDFSHIWWKQFGELWSTNEKWLWPLTVKLNRFLQVIEVHVHAKFHQAKCSGSWVIVFMEKNSAKNNTTVTSVDSDKTSASLKCNLKYYQSLELELLFWKLNKVGLRIS